MFMFRLQKLMDEYAGGVGSQFTTSTRVQFSNRRMGLVARRVPGSRRPVVERSKRQLER